MWQMWAIAVRYLGVLALLSVGVNASAQAQPQDRQRTLTPQEVDRGLVEEFKTRTWTPENIREINPHMISAALATLFADRPASTNYIKPPQMTAEQFHRMLMREAQRRGILDDYFAGHIDAENLQRIRNDDTLTNAVRSFARNSISFPSQEQGAPTNLQLNPVQVAIYDAATDMFFRNQATSALSADVARALNLPRKADGTSYSLGISTDIANYTLGYALGAMRELNPANPAPQAEVRITIGTNREQVQQMFCQNVPTLFLEGRGLSPRDAALSGFAQARIDAQSNFEARDIEVGLFGPCAPTQ